MTRRVEESDGSVFVLDLIRADMLGDAAHFTAGNVGMTNGVKQGGFAMINMPKNCYNWRTGFEVLRIFFQNNASPKRDLTFLFDHNFFLFKLGFITKFGRNDRRGIKIDLLIDAGHDAI